jgi:hypothetical protein
VDEFHGDVGLGRTIPRRDAAGLEDLRDAGVAKAGEDIGLVTESAKRCAGEQAGADDLERDAATGLILLGFVDAAHAALADEAEDAERADGTGERIVLIHELYDGGRGLIDLRAGFVEERFDFSAEGGIAGAAGIKEGGARGRRERGGFVEEVFDESIPRPRVHTGSFDEGRPG